MLTAPDIASILPESTKIYTPQTSFLVDENCRVGTMLLGKEGESLAVFVELAEISAQD